MNAEKRIQLIRTIDKINHHPSLSRRLGLEQKLVHLKSQKGEKYEESKK